MVTNISSHVLVGVVSFFAGMVTMLLLTDDLFWDDEDDY